MFIDEIIKRQPFWGEWVIDNKIGEGSFGSVYMISRQDYTFVNKAAMKVICVPKDQKEHDRILENSGSLQGAKRYCGEIRDRLLNEIKIMNQFKGNSQIVSMEDYKVEEAAEDDFGFSLLIRMELCKTVNAYIDNKQDYFANASELIRLGVSMCSALEVIHTNSLLHRDIKPGNIFVSQDGNFKLGDFGMAAGRYSGEENPHAAGTYDYMAPEVCNNLGYDVRADIYSLGLTLYYFANGLRGPYLESVFTAPTRNDKNIAFAKRMKNEKMLPPALVPKPLADVILRACAFDQNERYMSAREMKIALLSVERELYSSNVGNGLLQSGSISYSQSFVSGSLSTHGQSIGNPSVQGSVSIEPSRTNSGLVSGSVSVDNSSLYSLNDSSFSVVNDKKSNASQTGLDNKPIKKKKGVIIFLVSLAAVLLVSATIIFIFVFSSSYDEKLIDGTLIEETEKKANNVIDNVDGESSNKVDTSIEPQINELDEEKKEQEIVDIADAKENVVDTSVDETVFDTGVTKIDPILVNGSVDVYSEEGHILKGMSKHDIKIEAVFMDGTEIVDGEISLDCPEIITESGEYGWSFKPFSNEIYNEVEGTVQIKTFIPEMIEGLDAYNSVIDKTEILYLSLEDEGLTDIAFLAEATNLEKLNLDDNNLMNFNGLEKCEHLRTLAFNNNALLKDISAILGLKELTKVYTDSTGVSTNDLLLLDEIVKKNQN